MLIGVSIAFITCNYLDIWKSLKIDTIKRPLVKAIAVVAVDTAAALFLLIVMILIES